MGFDNVLSIQHAMSNIDSSSDAALYRRMYEEKIMRGMGITPEMLEQDRRAAEFRENLKREAALDDLIAKIVFVDGKGNECSGGADFGVSTEKAGPPEFNRVLDL